MFWILFGLGVFLVLALAVADGDEDIPVREASAKRKHLQIPLGKLDFQSDQYPDLYFCHRSDLEADLDPLVNSLIREGQAESVQVWQKPDSDRYLVIAGHRRVKALRRAAEQQSDPSITDEMLVDCVVIVTDNQADLLATSLATNAQRKDLSQLEILAAVKKLRDAGFSDARAAATIGYAKTQYQRFLAIVDNDQLYQLVRNGDIGMTKASRIIEAINKAQGQGHAQTLDDVLDDFADWCDKRRLEIRAAKEQYEAAGKKFPDNQANLDSYLTTDLLKQWIKLLEGGEPIRSDATFDYGIILDEKKGKLTIPGIANLDLRSVRATDLLKIVKAIVGLPRRLVPYIQQADYQERMRATDSVAGAIDPDFESFLQQTGLAIRFADFKRQAEAERTAQAGEAVPDGERAARPAGDLTAAIEAGMRRAGATPPSQLLPDDPEEREE